MKRLSCGVAVFALLLSCGEASACEHGSAVFACETRNHKRIELCSTSTGSGEIGSLQYRFGSENADGEDEVELEFPAERPGSLEQFFGAVYTYKGVYTESVRFVTDGNRYTVFRRRAEDSRDSEKGVEVRNQRSGKTTLVECNDERIRFYIFDLKDVLACDPATPVGLACIK